MKANNFLKLILILLFIFFLALYISQATGYYQYETSKKTTLTKEAMNRFEKDIKEGKELRAKNYLEEEKNYSNRASKLGKSTSNIIEGGFNLIMRTLFNQINSEISK